MRRIIQLLLLGFTGLVAAGFGVVTNDGKTDLSLINALQYRTGKTKSAFGSWSLAAALPLDPTEKPLSWGDLPGFRRPIAEDSSFEGTTADFLETSTTTKTDDENDEELEGIIPGALSVLEASQPRKMIPRTTTTTTPIPEIQFPKAEFYQRKVPSRILHPPPSPILREGVEEGVQQQQQQDLQRNNQVGRRKKGQLPFSGLPLKPRRRPLRAALKTFSLQWSQNQRRRQPTANFATANFGPATGNFGGGARRNSGTVRGTIVQPISLNEYQKKYGSGPAAGRRTNAAGINLAGIQESWKTLNGITGKNTYKLPNLGQTNIRQPPPRRGIQQPPPNRVRFAPAQPPRQAGRPPQGRSQAARLGALNQFDAGQFSGGNRPPVLVIPGQNKLGSGQSQPAQALLLRRSSNNNLGGFRPPPPQPPPRRPQQPPPPPPRRPIPQPPRPGSIPFPSPARGNRGGAGGLGGVRPPQPGGGAGGIPPPPFQPRGGIGLGRGGGGGAPPPPPRLLPGRSTPMPLPEELQRPVEYPTGGIHPRIVPKNSRNVPILPKFDGKDCGYHIYPPCPRGGPNVRRSGAPLAPAQNLSPQTRRNFEFPQFNTQN